MVCKDINEYILIGPSIMVSPTRQDLLYALYRALPLMKRNADRCGQIEY